MARVSTPPKTAASSTEATEDTSATPLEDDAPRVGSPGYDWSAHYDTDDLFRYTFRNGTVVALRTFNSIYSKTWLYKVQQMVRDGATDVDVEFSALERATCPTAHELLLNLPDDQGDPLNDLWLAWVASGTKPAPDAPDEDGLSAGKLPG